jgi:hypothetical protein
VVFTEFERCPANPSDILPGDVVMLHSTKNALGHDTNRATKVASWRQINDVLARKSPNTMLTAALRDKILDARTREVMAIRDACIREGADLDFMRARPQMFPSNQDLDDDHTDMFNFCRAVFDETRKLRRSQAGALFIPAFDWQAVPFLSEWSPDGILKSRGDDEHNASYFHSGGGDSGIDMNVAVQGPTTARNSMRNSFDKTPHEFAQVFDPEPRAMDNVYLLLVAQEEYDTPPPPAARTFKGYSFRLVPTSARIIEELEPRPNRNYWQTNPEACFPQHDGGLSFNTIANTVFAWRIGSVMDSSASTLSEQKITVNVNILPVSLYALTTRFGTHVGSLAVQPLIPVPPPPSPPPPGGLPVGPPVGPPITAAPLPETFKEMHDSIILVD